MKNPIKIYPNFTVFAISSTILLLYIFTACDYPYWIDDTPVPLQITQSPKSILVGPQGGSFTALNGIVSLEIPKDALNAEVKIRIKIGPEDDDMDFIIKSIIIYPKSLTFKIPARLHLKYDGRLSIGMDPSRAENLAIYHFRDEKTFDKRNPSDMIWINKIYVDTNRMRMNAEIHSGGIFAIGEESLDQTVHEPPF